MTMWLNQHNHLLQDRHYLDITVIDGEKMLPAVNGTYFILSLASELQSTTFSANGCYAAMIQQGTIKGQALSILMSGIHRNNLRVTSVDPTCLGNLSYIDGCSNSNLIDPDRNGDPCVNYLYFPTGIDQSFHVHPSERIGCVIAGRGQAEFYDHNGQLQSVELNCGDTFVLNRFCRHRFRTEDSAMSILAFHPDSDDGPNDQQNPMKTRTYLR